MHSSVRSRASLRRRRLASVEPLEARSLLSVGGPISDPTASATTAEVRPAYGPEGPAIVEIHQAILNVIQAQEAASAHPLMVLDPMGHGHGGGGGGTPAGLSPSQIKTAYGFSQLAQDGSGQTIYIVDAYNDPNITNDLNTFDTQYGLIAPPSLKVEYAQGSKPTTDSGWALEMSLDVEWAHAIAPAASIVLVEAASSSYADLFGAVSYAVNQGAHIVSMSWGGGDSASDSSFDSTFNVPGVAFVASAGDSGGAVEYPSASPYVLSVGGTTLNLNSDGTIAGETAWSSGGGGVSSNEAEPGYQNGVAPSLGGRGTPDVAYDADPNTGFAVYDSTSYYGQRGWFVVGGTSAGAPQWAGLIALADEGRSSFLSTQNQSSSPFYDAAASSFNYSDITSGSNGHPAGTGYDLATGLGSPKANALVPWLNGNN